jgi:hypothetical protein
MHQEIDIDYLRKNIETHFSSGNKSITEKLLFLILDRLYEIEHRLIEIEAGVNPR